MPDERLLLTNWKVTECNKSSFTNSLGRQNSRLQSRPTICHLECSVRARNWSAKEEAASEVH